jgi:hypothetical protein
MLCMECGAEMRLMEAVADETMMVPGYEHHTLMCPTCGEVERRLTFRSQPAPSETDPRETLSSVSPALMQKEQISTSGGWARVLAKLRRAHRQ